MSSLVAQSLGFPNTRLLPMTQRWFTPEKLVAHEEAYDQHEFLEDVNFTATILNGKVTPNRPVDPLASMGNLTEKLSSLAFRILHLHK